MSNSCAQLLIVIAVGLLPAASAATLAQSPITVMPAPEQTYCGAKEFLALDFLIGDWFVYDQGELMSTARTEKRQRGCWLITEEKWVNDKYRRPGQTFRFQTTTIFAFSNDDWKLTYLDVMGRATIMRGNPRDDGAVEFRSVEPFGGVFIKEIYERLSNGDVRMTVFTASDAEGRSEWKPMVEYIRKRVD